MKTLLEFPACYEQKLPFHRWYMDVLLYVVCYVM